MPYKINPWTGEYCYYKDTVDTFASAPTAIEGKPYINTTESKFYIRYNGAWIELHELAAPPTEFILMETGDTLLMETGDKLGME